MCGVSGFVLIESADGSYPRMLRAMNHALAHRGPDDEGYLFVNRGTGASAHFAGQDSPLEIKARLPQIDGAESWVEDHGCDLAFAHRRFAIISPTAEGHQPFWDRERRVVVVVNGEIYNYIEVREELEGLGHRFRTSTDTEVLVEAWREWKEDCFDRLNGMWAVALYDFDRRELVLCRDRTGERPLYWIRRPEGIYFASEIKALLATDKAGECAVDDAAAHNFLRSGVADLDAHTFFSGIESIPAATVVRIGCDGKAQSHRYWRMPGNRPSKAGQASIDDLCVELRALLRDSVRLRLRADVPINVALSGGMDSSSIVAMAATMRGEGLETYTVRFKEREWNEWPFARAVADRYRVNNFVVDPPSDWVWGYFERFVLAMEEPFHAPDLLPDHVVRRVLAARGIRVSLSGIGGDELFAGYEHYRRFRILDLKRSGHRLRAWGEIVSASHTNPIQGMMHLVLGKWRSMTDGGRVAARDDFWRRAFTTPSPTLRTLPESCEERLCSDIEWSLLPYWLRAGDKSSMAIPIEVRYPFLDHRLIEFASRLPVELLIREGWMKWILWHAMDEMLPREVVWRRQKMGFPFPIERWLEGAVDDLREIFGEMDNPYLAPRFWRENLADLIRLDPWLVWRGLSFELWHRSFIRGLPVLPARLAGAAESIADARAAFA